MASTLPPPEQRLIMHFTHVRHVATMINDGCVHADAHVGDRLEREVGDRGIKENRRSLPVTCAPGGHPCDYVPFYFAPKSPMLYKIARGFVEHYQEGQDPLVYLVSTIGDAIETGRPWLFSDGNCGAVQTAYFGSLDDLDTKIDWPLQGAEMWNSTAEDPTRATRRAAEFLVHEAMPWSAVRWLVVRSESMAVTVRSILNTAGDDRSVFVRPGWYYSGAKYL